MDYVHRYNPKIGGWESVPVRTAVEKATRIKQGWVEVMSAPAVEWVETVVSDVVSAEAIAEPEPALRRFRKAANKLDQE